MLRPLRLVPVKQVARRTSEDRDFFTFALQSNIPALFLSPCPKTNESASRRRYLKYMHAKSLREAFLLGASNSGLIWDYEHGYIFFPKHEPDLPGHVFGALELARAHNYTHVLEDLGYFLLRTAPVDFNSTCINMDFSLSPEPTRYQDVQPEVCDEHAEWKAAMDDEMRSMERFGVYKRVPKSSVRGRQILSCGWVYKRKVNRFGVVNRYRSRLVARGFLQRPYDSYNPDATYSPVCHKGSLRTFLSICGYHRLRVRG